VGTTGGRQDRQRNGTTLGERVATSTSGKEFTIPPLLGLSFVAVWVSFNAYLYLALIVVFVGLVQVYPLSSRFTENLLFCCLPVIGAIANYHHVCLTYNSIVLFMMCRGYAINGSLRIREIVLYFLIIASWIFRFDDSQPTTYAGAIVHGIVSPMSFYFYTRESRWIRLGVFLVPGLFLIDNIYVYRQWFVAFWDVEIICVYLFWLLDYDESWVVQKVLLFSLPLITFCQMYWPICPRTGYATKFVFDVVKSVLP
jgi:hypothetical protein